MLYLILVYTFYMICLTRCGMLGMCYAREVAYWAYGMLGMWWCWGCGMFEIWDVQDAGWCRCGMFRMQDDENVGCSWCGMFGVWDVRDLGVACGKLIYKIPRYFSYILTNNKSLTTYESRNDKQIWKCILLPKTYSDRVFQHYQFCCSFAFLNNLDIYWNLVEI